MPSASPIASRLLRQPKGSRRAAFSSTGIRPGGAEAEYVAAQTGLAGDTFGAPGIAAGDITAGEKSNLTNFVDYGDPVGNYSDNPNRGRQPVVRQ